MRKKFEPKQVRQDLKFNNIDLHKCNASFPVPASYIVDELSTHNTMVRQLTKLGFLKKYRGTNGYYTNKSFLNVKSFFDDYKQQNGRYPTLKALVIFCETLCDK